MSSFVLWIDHDAVKIFDFSPTGETVKHLRNNHHMDHHTGHFEQERVEQQKKFYKEVSDLLSPSGKILLLGPDMAKHDFKRYLDEHHQSLVAKNIVGIETLAKMPDSQIRDFAKDYFKKYNLFNT